MTRPINPIAVPDIVPGTDARAAIQHALDTLGYAYLPAGEYWIDTPQVAAPKRRAYQMLSVLGTQLFGDGPSTMLRFRGSAHMRDWRGIELGGEDAWIADLAIDTSELVDTSEQTHAIHAIGPAARLTVQRCTINHPIRRTEKGGDAIQLVGYDDGRLIVDVLIDDNDITADRSAVGIHSGTSRLRITNNRTTAGNTDFDFEGSGDTFDVEIDGNTCTAMRGVHGVGSLQLQLVTRADVHDNTFLGRGIDVYQSDDIDLHHNTICQTQIGGAPVISITKNCSRINVHHNAVIRAASAGPGSVIYIGPHGTGTPDHVIVADNSLLQQTIGQLIQTIGLVGLDVLRNLAVYTGVGPAYGIVANGSSGPTGLRTDGIRVVGNTWLGALKGVIGISGSYAGCGAVATSDNYAPDATGGIVGSGASTGAGILGPITSTRDAMPAPVCGPLGFVAVT